MSSNRTYYKKLEEQQNKVVRPSRERANPFNGHEELLTDIIFLIGNGKSRQIFNLERLRGLGTIIGCNALYRDFEPDLLTVIDAKMIEEVDKAGYAKDHKVILPANRQRTIKDALVWRTTGFNTAGCFNMKLASELMLPRRAYMLGMDAYPGNVYDATPNYSPNTLQNFDGVLRHYNTVLNTDAPTIFYNVNKKDTWNSSSPRYKFITYKEFEKHIKNGFN